MGLFGKLLVGIVGFYAGVYCDQNYKLPSVSEPAQLLDEVNKWLEEYKNSKNKVNEYMESNGMASAKPIQG